MFIKPRFLYRGDASGVSAIVTHTPREKFQPPQYINARGASSLPQIGGRSEQSLGPERIPEEVNPFLHFQQVLTSAFGREAEDSFVTDVAADVSGLQIGNEQDGVVFKADRLHAQLQSVHPRDPKAQPRISWAGTDFAGVRLVKDNKEFPIHLRLDKELEPLVREQDMADAYASDPVKYAKKFFRVTRSNRRSKKIPRVGKNRYIMCSLVESVTTEYPGADWTQHVLTVPDFGTIFFGEVTVAHDSRTLTLVRFTLGSPLGGEMSSCSVRSNGEPITTGL